MTENILETPSYIGVIGLAKAGKGEVTKHLRVNYDYTVIRPSQGINEQLTKIHGARLFSRQEYREMGTLLRNEYGPGYYFDDIPSDVTRVLIDGTRHLDTAQLISQRGGFLIGVVARDEIRYARSRSVFDKSHTANIKDFVQEELPELNSLCGRGQILPILWSIDPEDIIDTSEISLSELASRIDMIMIKHDVIPTADDTVT
jgi:hypothetical protein